MAEYSKLLARAIAGPQSASPEARRAIYERADIALQNHLRNTVPAPNEEIIARERARLREAFEKIEQEYDTPNSDQENTDYQTEHRIEPQGTDVALPRSIAVTIPRVLRLSDQSKTAFTTGFAIVLGLSTSFFCFRMSPESSMIHKTFDPRSTNSIIPVIIFCLFFWGVSVCYLRILTNKAYENNSAQSVLHDVMQLMSVNADISYLSKYLNIPSVTFSPLLRKIRILVDQWIISPGLENSDVVLSTQISIENDLIQREYSKLKVIIWALPVLGLIGTVLGIADAVGGFADFLGQDISEVAKIRQKVATSLPGFHFLS